MGIILDHVQFVLGRLLSSWLLSIILFATMTPNVTIYSVVCQFHDFLIKEITPKLEIFGVGLDKLPLSKA